MKFFAYCRGFRDNCKKPVIVNGTKNGSGNGRGNRLNSDFCETWHNILLGLILKCCVLMCPKNGFDFKIKYELHFFK